MLILFGPVYQTDGIIDNPSRILQIQRVRQPGNHALRWADGNRHGGIPGVQSLRSLSLFGLSDVQLVFEDGTSNFEN